jgi:hypothetical protein
LIDKAKYGKKKGKATKKPEQPKAPQEIKPAALKPGNSSDKTKKEEPVSDKQLLEQADHEPSHFGGRKHSEEIKVSDTSKFIDKTKFNNAISKVEVPKK